ncbi:MAG TPA: hypothetical protein PKC43_09880 [Phycisphaerales bacterium]|nr:hypothetical protein [Phycisphaerales bacterium]HMP37743.1 hypothetical protein [Phycisphaerales bacterium]
MIIAIAPMCLRSLVTPNWDALRPTSWLLADLRRNPADGRAWSAMHSRLLRGTLSEAAESAILEVIVADLPHALADGSFGFRPWSNSLSSLLERRDSAQAARWAVVDALFPEPTLAVTATSPAKQGERMSLKLNWSLKCIRGVETQFRVLGVRVDDRDGDLVPVWPGSAGSGGSGSSGIRAESSGASELRFAPMAGPGPVAMSLIVVERRGFDMHLSSAVGVMHRPGGAHEPLDAADDGLWGAGGSRWTSDAGWHAIVDPIRERMHEVPFTIDIEPASDAGVVHPALFGGLGNFEIIAVRVRRLGPRGDESTEVDVDVRGPRDVPVAYSVSVGSTSLSQVPIGTFLFAPEESPSPGSVRTVTVRSNARLHSRADHLVVRLTPDWFLASRQRPEWSRIWGGRFVFPDVPVERSDP